MPESYFKFVVTGETPTPTADRDWERVIQNAIREAILESVVVTELHVTVFEDRKPPDGGT